MTSEEKVTELTKKVEELTKDLEYTRAILAGVTKFAETTLDNLATLSEHHQIVFTKIAHKLVQSTNQ